MIITVGNTKGGVGKTTLALQIAIARARAGRRVWLIDADRQATAASAISIRNESGQQPMIPCSSFTEGPALRAQVELQGANWDDVIIDAGGRDSAALRAAIGLSDVIVIPFAPRSFDVWALTDIAALVDETRSARARVSNVAGNQLRAYAVLNQADPHGTDNADAAAAVADVAGIEYIDTPIRRRKALANAAGAGLSAAEMKPTDAKAVAEIEALISMLFDDNTQSK